jgi:branched-chain amino acid aminotransferase
MGTESKLIWMDGELVEYEKATVHALSPALHYGAAVFEGIRAYRTDKGPAIFRLREHVDRLI